MTRSILGRLRRFWLDVHLWIGVGLLVALIPLGISGSLLVWHDALDKTLNAERFEITGPAAKPPSAYLAAAREAFGDQAVAATLRMPAEPQHPVTVVGRVKGPPGPGGRPRQLTAWIDPATAKVLDVADIRQSFTGVMHRLHGSLLIPGQGVGRKVVGWLGWAMTLSCLTGLWLWWPRNGAVLKALRWRRSPSTLNNLHHMFGFWILVPLLVVSLTGVYISFPQTSRALFGVAQPGQQPPRGPRPAGPPPLALTNLGADEAAGLALRANPGAALAVVNLPTQGKAPEWRIELSRPGQERPVQVKVSDVDGAVSAGRSERGGGGGGPDPLSRLMRQVHDGADTPFVWQVLVFLTGIAPPLLGITGTVMWLRRRHRRKAIRRGHDQAAA